VIRSEFHQRFNYKSVLVPDEDRYVFEEMNRVRRPWVFAGVISLAMVILLPLVQHVKGVFLLWQAKQRMENLGVSREESSSDTGGGPPALIVNGQVLDRQELMLLEDLFGILESLDQRLFNSSHMMAPVTPETARPINSLPDNVEWDQMTQQLPRFNEVLTDLRRHVDLSELLEEFDTPFTMLLIANQQLAVWHGIEGRYGDATLYCRELMETVLTNPVGFESDLLRPCWEMLHCGKGDPAFLADLQNLVEDFDLLGAASEAKKDYIRNLANMADRSLPPPGSHTSHFGFPTSSASARFAPFEKPWKRFVEYFEWIKKAYLLRDETNARILNAELDELEAIAALQKRESIAAHFYSSSVLPPGVHPMTPARARRDATLHQLLLTAIALERYELEHGEYPLQLDILISFSYLSELPYDYYAMGPLRYHCLKPHEFLLYSIGPDGVDNGGVSARFLSEPDIVWPRAVVMD